MMEWMKKMFSEHRWVCLCVIGALILGILLLTIGFFRTLLLLLLVAAAGGLGYLLDKGGWPAVEAFFQNLFGKKE